MVPHNCPSGYRKFAKKDGEHSTHEGGKVPGSAAASRRGGKQQQYLGLCHLHALNAPHLSSRICDTLMGNCAEPLARELSQSCALSVQFLRNTPAPRCFSLLP